MTRLTRAFIHLTIPLVLVACALLAPSATGREPGSRARAATRPTAHAASRYQVGIGDEYAGMFGSALWQQLHTKIARYIAPVLKMPGGETVLATTERYLGNDRNVEATARDLEIHPNTVRQRLDRFEESTGRSLRETETTVEVWWAFHRRRVS